MCTLDKATSVIVRSGKPTITPAVLLPRDPEVWYRLSLAERGNGNPEAALGSAERAIRGLLSGLGFRRVHFVETLPGARTG